MLGNYQTANINDDLRGNVFFYLLIPQLKADVSVRCGDIYVLSYPTIAWV